MNIDPEIVITTVAARRERERLLVEAAEQCARLAMAQVESVRCPNCKSTRYHGRGNAEAMTWNCDECFHSWTTEHRKEVIQTGTTDTSSVDTPPPSARSQAGAFVPTEEMLDGIDVMLDGIDVMLAGVQCLDDYNAIVAGEDAQAIMSKGNEKQRAALDERLKSVRERFFPPAPPSDAADAWAAPGASEEG